VKPRKGVILAGGTGSRLVPLTRAVNKHLLPVYDKPMIYYPLTTLMFSGVRDIILVTSSDCIEHFTALLGNGSQWGLNLIYRVQDRPAGIADGLRIAAPDLLGHDIVLILGDNIFFGAGLPATLSDAIAKNIGATVLGYQVANPSEFGVVTLDAAGRPLDIEEKPANPKSRIAVTGLYIYAADVIEIVEQLKPSSRGELEITDINRVYLEQGRLNVRILGRGTAWLDGGRPGDLYEASQFVKVMQDRTGLRIACPEELAYRLGLIDKDALERLIEMLPSPSDYRSYLSQVLHSIL
jgi:glucose-1-phosphate thymidylyltransferase